MLQIKPYPRDMNIIQIYAFTTQKPDTEILQFYSDAKQLLNGTVLSGGETDDSEYLVPSSQKKTLHQKSAWR